MNTLNITREIGIGLAFLLTSLAAFAVTATPSSVSVASESYQTITISNIKGSVSLKNSKPDVIKISKIRTNVYRIYGTKAGTALIEFKDKKSKANVYVTVTPKPKTTTTLNGRLLASNCFQCHGTNGTGGFERLTGNSAKEIYSELREFVSGKEDADGIMAAHAMGFSDTELQAIANYFASVR